MKEQRGYVRLNVGAHAKYKVKGLDSPQDMVTLEDVGCSGIRIIISKKLNESDVLDLCLEIPGIEGTVDLEGKAVWQRQVTMDLLDTGIHFTHIDDENKEKLFKFIEQETGRTVERREFVRCDFAEVITYNRLDNPEIKNNFNSVDVCSVGLKVMSKEMIEKGTQLCIEFNVPGNEEKIVAKCTVVAWVKKNENDFFEIVIEFLEINETDKQKIEQYIKTACKK